MDGSLIVRGWTFLKTIRNHFFENVNIHRNYVVGELVIDSSSSSRNETLREKTFFYCRPKCKVRNGSRTKCQSYYRSRPWVLQPISNCLVNRDPICALEYFMRGSCIYQKKLQANVLANGKNVHNCYVFVKGKKKKVFNYLLCLQCTLSEFCYFSLRLSQ